MLYPPKCTFLTPFKWQKKKITLLKIFSAICSRCHNDSSGNNNISLTEFSNFTGLFMEDVNTCYGGRYKHTTNGFPFLLLNYSQIPQYGHFSYTDTSILWTVINVR